MPRGGRRHTGKTKHRVKAQAHRHAAPLADPDLPEPVPRGEVRLFGRAIREGWKMPQVAREQCLKRLRQASAGRDERTALQAARILALIDQRELDLTLKADSLQLKREALDIKREQLGIERESLDRTQDQALQVTVEFVNELLATQDPEPGAACTTD